MPTFPLWMWKQNDTQMKPEFEEIMYSIPDPVSKLTMFSHPRIGHHKTSELGRQMWNLADFLASFMLIPFLSLKQVTESRVSSL